MCFISLTDPFILFIILILFLFLIFCNIVIPITQQETARVEADLTYTTSSNAIKHVTECSYKKDVTVYMDAFDEVSRIYFGKSYQGLISKARHCKPLPGGGRCLFNHDNKSSDAIFYYGGYTNLEFTRVFSEQIVIVFTKESERGRNCHFPPSSQYVT